MFFQSLPFFLSEYRNNTLTRFYYPIHWDHLFLYLLCIPILTQIELSVLLFIVGLTKHHMSLWRASKFVTAVGQTITIFAALFVATYFFSDLLQLVLLFTDWIFSRAGDVKSVSTVIRFQVHSRHIRARESAGADTYCGNVDGTWILVCPLRTRTKFL